MRASYLRIIQIMSLMKDNNLDKMIEDMKETFNSSRIEAIEASCKEIYGEKWTTLSEAKKQLKLKEILNFADNPQNKHEIRKVEEKLKHFLNLKFNIGILFLGVLLGISGNLVANLLDRDFLHYGFSYDVVVTGIFFFSLWYINRMFIKKSEEEMTRDKTFTDLSAIINKID